MSWGRSEIAGNSLENEFSTDNRGLITSDGCHNAGVYIVRRRRDDLRCVEKRITPKEICNGAAYFEMSLLRQLRHANITRYIDAFIVDGNDPKASIYMEYCDQGTLLAAIETQWWEGQPFEEEFMWKIFADLTNAVAYCQYGIRDAVANPHEPVDPSWLGIIHRDIKPSNVFLRTDLRHRNQLPVAVLGDFGIAMQRNKNGVHWNEAGDQGLPIEWAPPESPEYRYASDVWAVGMVVQAVCRLQLNGEATRFWGVGCSYSSRLNQVVQRTMRYKPGKRYRIDRLAREIARWMGGRRTYRKRHSRRRPSDAKW